MSKNMEHSSDKTPRVGAQVEIYKFHTSVISTHFFDQVQIFFFFTHCIVIKVRQEHIGTWTGLLKKIWTIIFTSYY